ncbi:MAG: S8 family peptidase [Flavobacteriales bacterium]|nr:S8 family peptidase [Flavobacteriales bacterium]
MKRLLLIICLIAFSFAHAQKEKTVFYVVFEHTVSFTNTENILDEIAELKAIAEKYNIGFKLGIHLSKNKKKHLEDCSKKAALRKNKESYTKLSNIFIVYKKGQETLDVNTLKSELEKLEQVKYCYISIGKTPPPPSLASGDIPPTTDDFSANQTYIQSNPGVNMQYAWDKGYSGAGISIADIEYGMNPNHEDLAYTNTAIATGLTISSALDPAWINHGTAVAGIVYAADNGFGITGMAHSATKFTFYPEFTDEEGTYRIQAITRAIEESKKGDVIIFEMQAFGLTELDYVPAEYDKIVWELTKAASDSGITIVAAAGNGNVNLDADGYKPYMEYGDSGAIIVGGGTPDTAHNKVASSNYGNRVNLQGWSEKVWSISKHGHDYPAGTCTVTIFGEDDNQAYTSCFRGTSSATPIIASCIAVLQGYYHSQTQDYLTPVQIRDLLISTGISQGSGGHIGPLPDMKAAMEKVDADYLLSTPSESYIANFIVSPNPTNGTINVVIPEYFSNNNSIEVYNALGQLITLTKGVTGINSIDLSRLQPGVYIVQVTDEKYIATKRVVKR